MRKSIEVKVGFKKNRTVELWFLCNHSKKWFRWLESKAQQLQNPKRNGMDRVTPTEYREQWEMCAAPGLYHIRIGDMYRSYIKYQNEYYCISSYHCVGDETFLPWIEGQLRHSRELYFIMQNPNLQ